MYSGRNWRFGQIGYCVLGCLRPTYVLEDKVFLFLFLFFKNLLLILHLLNVIRFVER